MNISKWSWMIASASVAALVSLGPVGCRPSSDPSAKTKPTATAEPDEKESKSEAGEKDAKDDPDEKKTPHEGKEKDAKGDADEKDTKGEAGGEESKSESPIKLKRDDDGNTLLTIPEEVQERVGLKVKPVEEANLSPTVAAYGRLEIDPSTSFAVRSPIAGYLRIKPETTWPLPGTLVQAGTPIGFIEPRLSPIERNDLMTRLATARAEVDEVSADLTAAQSSYESKKELNKTQKVVSERVIEEAHAKVESGLARLAAAKETVSLLDNAMNTGHDPKSMTPISADREGQVIEVLAQPGESVEPGEALLRTTEASHLIARVATPPGTVLSGIPTEARLSVVGSTHIIDGKVLANPPPVGVDPGMSFLISLTTSEPVIRPGLAVVAQLEVPGEAMRGVVVPRAAVIRYGGSAFVYVRTSKTEFTRMPVGIDEPTDAGWFVAGGLGKGANVVVTGAGSLLSEELRGQIEAEAQGEE